MKKIALLPIVALMLAVASCSDDNNEPARPAVPTDPVVSVESVADQVTIDAPDQDINFEYDEKANLYAFNYANGQKISYTLTQQYDESGEAYNVAVVRKISGASEVVIPGVVKTKRASDGSEIIYPVYCLGIYENGVSDDVKKLVVAKEASKIYSNTALQPMTAAKIRELIYNMPSVASVELENGYPGFCSIDGAIYTSNLNTLIAVPRAREGVFTIAENTKVVDTQAIAHCTKITGITFPAAIESIGNEAVTYNDMLVLINMLPAETPMTSEHSFGRMAKTSVLRIPVGSKDSYFPEFPDLKEPVPPLEPDDEASFEEWDEYYYQESLYQDDLAAYKAAMAIYDRPIGFRQFKDVEEVNF